MSDEGQGWLERLSAEEWLAAATGELERAAVALSGKQQRAGVTQARRAAGMAWNAVLLGIVDLDERARYGRSYMDHLRVLRDEPTASPTLRDAATALVGAALDQQLVQLGAGDTRLASAATTVLEEARRRVDDSARS
ncbi:MAG: hypothetical protein ABI321_02575 [Polyangia bacterium]